MNERTDSTREMTSGRTRAIRRVAERELARGPASISETRRWLRATAASVGITGQAADELLLVASELLANAFLHASGPFSVVLEVERDVLRIAVRDRSLTVPVVKAFDELAATGRGLRIVEASSLAWGADMHVDGKTVWADLALPAAAAPDDAEVRDGSWARRGGAEAAARLHPARGRSSTSSSGTEPNASGKTEGTAARTGSERRHGDALKRVVFLGLPVAAFIATRSRVEAALRESTLIVLGRDHAEIPPELLQLAERTTEQFRDVARAEAAAPPEPVRVDDRAEVGDFAIYLPESAGAQLEAFADAVRSLNGWCASNQLLADPLTDEMLSLHQWSMEEARRQIDGAPPAPFEPRTD